MADPHRPPRDLIRRISRAHARVLDLLDGLDEERTAQPSALPGWTRGHVVQHLTDNARAFERQARFALRGELVEM
ncbi:maleylpyruvate isomerase N-terminal domain-containing protein [Nocardiopsis sp. EMB25]|nr:maleylpyruvate isomerase N-terminal domain-containing protein [Nocardiopsis sp. EMB25]